MRTLVLLVFAAAVAAAAPVPKVAKKSDAELLEGKWVSVSHDSGTGHERDTRYQLEVKDGKLHSSYEQNKGFTGVSFNLDPSLSPKHIDITAHGGGMVLNWIYEIDGDTLTLGYPGYGKPRLTEMTAGGPDARHCIVYKRVKE